METFPSSQGLGSSVQRHTLRGSIHHRTPAVEGAATGRKWRRTSSHGGSLRTLRGVAAVGVAWLPWEGAPGALMILGAPAAPAGSQGPVGREYGIGGGGAMHRRSGISCNGKVLLP